MSFLAVGAGDSAGEGARVGGGRRLPAVELRLPELPRRPRGRRSRAAPAHAGVRRGERRRRTLVPAQRLARDPRPDRELPRAAPARARATRRSRGILLTNGDLDHCLGLLSLRESHPLAVYATERVRRGFIDGNVLYRTLERFPGQVDLARADARPRGGAGRPGRRAERAHGRRPWRCPASCRCTSRGASRPIAEDNVGLRIRERSTGRALAYFSGVGGRDARRVPTRSSGADCVFFDGTFWSSDELIALGLGTQARGGHGAPAGRRRRRAASLRSPACRAGAAHLHPHQQHQPDPARRLAGAAGGRGAPAGRSPRDGMEMGCDRGAADAAARSRARRVHRVAAARGRASRYHDHHRFHVLMHDGQAHRAAAPAVGAEPLLLPDAHPDQGRDHPLEVGGPGVPPHVDPPHPATTTATTAGEGGLELWLRLADGRGPRSGGGGELPLGAAGRALRLRRLRRAGARAQPARGGGLVAHRVLRARPDVASASLAWEQHYPWVQPGDARRTSARACRAPGATRRRRSTSSSRTRRPTRCRSAAWPRSIRKTEILWHLLDCDVRRLRRSRLGARGGPRALIAAGRTAAARRRRSRLRFDRSPTRFMLLYPERGLVLNPTAADIVQRCTGERTVAAIVDAARREVRAAAARGGRARGDRTFLDDHGRPRRAGRSSASA